MPFKRFFASLVGKTERLAQEQPSEEIGEPVIDPLAPAAGEAIEPPSPPATPAPNVPGFNQPVVMGAASVKYSFQIGGLGGGLGQTGLGKPPLVSATPASTPVAPVSSAPVQPSAPAGSGQSVDALFQQAINLHQQGQLVPAKGVYEQILAVRPEHADALQMLGLVAYQMGQPKQAASLMSQAVAIDPRNAGAQCNLGNVLKDLGQFDQALNHYNLALEAKPDMVQVYSNRGIVLRELGQLNESIASFDHAVELHPEYAEAYSNRATTLIEMGRLDDALSDCDRAIAIRPVLAEAYSTRSRVWVKRQQYDRALSDGTQVIQLRPQSADAFISRAQIRIACKQFIEALEDCEQALSLNHQSIDFLCVKAHTLLELKRANEALSVVKTVLSVQPEHVQAQILNALSFRMLRRWPEALDSYERLAQSCPDDVKVHLGHAQVLREMKMHEQAVVAFDRVIALDPEFAGVKGFRLYSAMHVCDWHQFDEQVAEIEAMIRAMRPVAQPFSILAATSSAEVLQIAARLLVQREYSAPSSLSPLQRYPRHDKIRVGYFSADFHNHATTYLMAELLELHDREHFEWFGFSFGISVQDEMRQRVSSGFDHFYDVSDKSDEQIVELARSLEIDIAIDLKGFTADSRTRIFALRAAPIQVNYLGFPGTMGAGFIDYIVADSVLIPPGSEVYCDEKVAYLPGSYQCNDSKRVISDHPFTRAEVGLPDGAMVYCAFNNNFKITPAVFDTWMRILKQVDRSVLWLLEDNEVARRNLIKEAGKRGIEESRLVFAPRMDLPLHLARHRMADLFLDNLPCNAHTTASDSLWAGLPLLTCAGEAFTGRVAASLLQAVGLPDLVVSDLAEYERLAVELGRQPAQLMAIRERLKQNLQGCSLYDTRTYARHLESAYQRMYDRERADLKPDHIRMH